MKNTSTQKLFFLLLTLTLTLSSCHPEDGMDGAMGLQGIQGEQGPKGDSGENEVIPKIVVFGKWEVTSGFFAIDHSKFVYINEDNTINILAEDALGFKKDLKTNAMVTLEQITLSGGEIGSTIINYMLDGDVLTLIPPSEIEPIVMERRPNDNEAENWVKKISILNEGEVPWDRDIDIAFDGTYVVGYNENDRTILKIDPSDFSVADAIPTTNSAFSVEIEKSNSTTRQLFQSNNGSDTFKSYIYSSNNLYYTSEVLGSWIRGIASVAPGYLWASSSSESSLYNYKSNGSLTPGEILETIPLNFQPEGLDFQDGFLYVTERNLVHKCQTSPNFRAIETYKIARNTVYGIAYDGTNFWLSTGIWEDNNFKSKLLKVDIPL